MQIKNILQTIIFIFNTLYNFFDRITQYPIIISFSLGFIIGILVEKKEISKTLAIPINIILHLVNIILLLFGIGNQIIIFIQILLEFIDILSNISNVAIQWIINKCSTQYQTTNNTNQQ